MIRVIDVTNPPAKKVKIGHYGEDNFRIVTFDVSKWKAMYPNGSIVVIFKRGDGEIYPVILKESDDGNAVDWSPSSVDTAFVGDGFVEVYLYEQGVVGKSCIIPVEVCDALDAYGDRPEAVTDDWLARIDYASQVANDLSEEIAEAKNILSEHDCELGIEDLGDGVARVYHTSGEKYYRPSILYTNQNLSLDQQETARSNIGIASKDNALEVPRDTSGNIQHTRELDDGTIVLSQVSYEYDDSAGNFVFTGNNDSDSSMIFYATKGTLSSGTARKPPAGIYRLELTSEDQVDFTQIWGCLYHGTSNPLTTDPSGKSIEVYLDGDTMVTAAIVFGPWASFVTNIRLKIALRRIDAPEVGALLVDQINQMRALQQKTMAILDNVTKFHGIRDSLTTLSGYTNKVVELMDNDQFYVNYAGDVLPANDLNSLMDLPGYRLIVVTYNDATLNTPAKANLTGSYTRGVVFHYHRADSSHGIDIAIVPGGGQILKRRIHSGIIEAWEVV